MVLLEPTLNTQSCTQVQEEDRRGRLVAHIDLVTLLTGKAEGDGKMHITLCDFIVPWDTLSITQKKSLNHRYQMGCECKVSKICIVAPPCMSPHPSLALSITRSLSGMGVRPWLLSPSG
jgi:hypothetical protein